MDNAKSKSSRSDRSVGSFPTIDVESTAIRDTSPRVQLPHRSRVAVSALGVSALCSVIRPRGHEQCGRTSNEVNQNSKEFTVFLNLSHSSLRTLVLGGDVTLTHMCRSRDSQGVVVLGCNMVEVLPN